MRWAWRGLLLACAFVLAPMTATADIVVSAAVSLTNAFTEIGKAYEGERRTRVVFNFAASDILVAQLSKGAPADVLASADEDAMNRAERAGVVLSNTRRNFASNRMALVTPAGASSIKSLDQLALPSVRRIAIGTPKIVPAGRYAMQALEARDLGAKLHDKLVFATNVRQALDYVARREAEAGFVYVTDAALMPDKVRIAFEVSTPTPIRYPIAVATASRSPDAARAFIDFLATPKAQQILVRYGFGLPVQP